VVSTDKALKASITSICHICHIWWQAACIFEQVLSNMQSEIFMRNFFQAIPSVQNVSIQEQEVEQVQQQPCAPFHHFSHKVVVLHHQHGKIDSTH